MVHQPPRVAKSLLRRFCHVTFLEEIEGDLDEQFNERVSEKGLFIARLYYFLEVVRAITNGNNKGRTEPVSRLSYYDSFIHFQKIFFRNLRYNRSSSIINIFGLALSLASFIVIYFYVTDELTYDSFHNDPNNTYRLSYSYKRYGDGNVETDARAGGMWAPALKESMADVKLYTRFSRFGYPGFVRNKMGDRSFEEKQFFFSDSNYTDVFQLTMVKGGEATKLLSNPAYVIVSETAAAKYFGEEDPVGQEITYSRGGIDFSFIVGGVMKNYPSNAHFHPEFMASNLALDPLWKKDGEDRINSWFDTFTYSFVILEDGTDPAKATSALTAIFRKNSDNPSVLAVLTKLTDIHFTHGMLVELEGPGDKMYVYIFGSIGILILAIASINYMNLATARSVRRSKEVGLRKTLGVRRTSLIFQFLSESMMLIGISFLLSVILLIVILPFFNQLTGKEFSAMILFQNRILLLILLGVVVALAVVSGSYPAFYLSRFKPGDVLKGKIITGSGAENFRKVLVVFQFTITILLIVSAVVIHNQMDFIRSGKLAANDEQIMTVRLWGESPNKKRKLVVLNELIQKNSHVRQTSLSDHLPQQFNSAFRTLPFVFPTLSPDQHMWDHWRGDENFATMFDLEFLAGRNFSYAIPTDTNSIILNEAAVKDLNLSPERVIGIPVEIDVDFDDANHHLKGTVVGVIKDFHYSSAHNKIPPMVLSARYLDAETLNIRLDGDNYQETINELEKVWKGVFPENPFRYWFMDFEFNRLYKQETQLRKLSDYFAGFTVIIACLGLFGLASFTVEQKSKEIGIRKVLGASISQILLLLTNRFVRLILISFFVAVPLSYYAMQSWLEGFAYKVDMNWYVFGGTGMFILLLTYVTVGIESTRAAMSNPVDSIKHE